MELVRPDIRIDFVSQLRLCAALSLAALLVSVGLMLFRGFNLGIEFAGGTVIELRIPAAAGAVGEGALRSAMEGAGYEGTVVTRIGTPEERDFSVSLKRSQAEERDLSVNVESLLNQALGTEVEVRRVESIGPRVGSELRTAAAQALLISWGCILLYIWFRFDLRYAPGAVAALIHDVLITAGVFVLLGWEFNLQVLAALLVVIGYSLNDTIVIYDRIRENLEVRGTTHLEDVVNQSINQTLSRTLLTSLTTLIVVVAMVALGGPVLRGFAVALLIGVVIGTYSTIYVASALLIFLERRYGSVTAAR